MILNRPHAPFHVKHSHCESGHGLHENTFDSNLEPVRPNVCQLRGFPRKARDRGLIRPTVLNSAACARRTRSSHSPIGGSIQRERHAERARHAVFGDRGNVFAARRHGAHGRRGRSRLPGDLYAAWPLTICPSELPTAKAPPSNTRPGTACANAIDVTAREGTPALPSHHATTSVASCTTNATNSGAPHEPLIRRPIGACRLRFACIAPSSQLQIDSRHPASPIPCGPD